MPNIASVLKEEITRLARKEAKAQVAPLKKAVFFFFYINSGYFSNFI